MARTESKTIMGYYAIEQKHHAAITSLVTPATPAHKLLDPFAGEGVFLEVAAHAWQMTPYANELDGQRAAACVARFGATQAVRGDVERLVASQGSFSIGWFNPPYDHDATASAGNKRLEFRYLRHAWKWIQEGGLVLWAVYQQHLTEQALAFFAKHSTQADVWALPGKHLGEYDQIVVVAVKGTHPNPNAHYAALVDAKSAPRPLTVQAEPVYTLPAPPRIQRFVFAPDLIDEAQGLTLIQTRGAWQTQGFQALLEVPPPPPQIEPVVAPRPGHLALVLAAGVADGAVIETDEYGTVAIRGKTQPVEQIARVEVESDPNDPERQIKKTTLRLKPTTTLTLLGADGTHVEMQGDEALLGFITRNKSALADYLNTRFQPCYRFDFNGLGDFLGRIRLNGKYPLYIAQKHVIAAITKGFERRRGILLVGQMGTGKTAMGGTAGIAIAAGAVRKLGTQMRPEQVVLVVCPPHLMEKWKRELLSIHPNSLVQQLNRHEDVAAFMDKAARIGAGIPKIGLIKRDLTKLGGVHQSAVVWRKQPVALWRQDAPIPDGYTAAQRVETRRVAQCPHCGCAVTYERKGVSVPATETWLKGGKRSCEQCHSPLWTEARDSGSRPKVGQKYASKNPRYRLDRYIQQRYGKRVYLLIWDEIHEAANGDTGNGEAFGRLAGVAERVLAMTGTPFNGKSSSLFNIEYHLNARVRQQFNWGGAPRLSRKVRGSFTAQQRTPASQTRGRAESRWVEVMGVREQVVEERPTYDSQTGAYTGTSTYERPYEESPGVSPLLVAEVLDHAVFFSLPDLGKALPQYEEIAVPVPLEDDIAAEYERTRALLKDYLIARRWEGDTSFRGAYLQWSMGWVNSTHRPYEVIHNLKHPLTGETTPHTVTRIPSYGEERLYAKERALVDLLRDELAAGRPCVVYVRQTATKDIQPRLEALIRAHVADAVPYILKNTVGAERREAVIDAERGKGMNVLITNPELIKTGLDLVHSPTLIFYEITFNLGTMMQAAARAYRLNQMHRHCKTYYLFAQDTMEHTAVQLMSRKQRAAKLLTGEVGLTGLEALTEGESGFEEALLNAIASDERLVDPQALFTADAATHALDAEDFAYWNADTASDVEEVAPTDWLADSAQTLGAVITPVPAPTRTPQAALNAYLETVHILHDRERLYTLQVALWTLLHTPAPTLGALHDTANHPAWVAHITEWLERERLVFAGCEHEVAAQVIKLAQAHSPSPEGERLPVPVKSSTPRVSVRKPKCRQPDLLAVPDDPPNTEALPPLTPTHMENPPPVQLSLF